MASTYTAAGIQLITTGEQNNTWGATTNTNWNLIEELVAGVISIALSSTTYTLTTSDGSLSEGRHAVIIFTGSPGGTCTVTVSPNDLQKVYFIRNDSDQTVTLTQGSGGNVSITSGKKAIVSCDGAGASAAIVELQNTSTLTDFGVTATAAELNILDGVTASTAELNILDGLTASTANLNTLDGATLDVSDVTATATELNYNDGASPGTLAASKTVVADASSKIPLGSTWKVYESGGYLYFEASGTGKAKLDSSGNMTITGSITAGGTI
jgi:hypothetical protein